MTIDKRHRRGSYRQAAETLRVMEVRNKTTMRINCAQLLKGHTGVARRLDLSEDITGIDEDLRIESPITGPLTLIRTADGILLTASLGTDVELECRRCLESFSAHVEFDLQEEFHPSVDIQTGAKIPVADTEEDATIIDEHHVLDMTEVVRQGIILAIPMSPLCREDCAGLCSVCGQNLNEGQCQCVTDTVDPRLKVLKELLQPH
jgi:uncharacterized protein